GFRHRDRLGVGEGAEVPAGAADQVGESADVGGGEPEGLGLLPELEQPGFFHVGEDDVLAVGAAYLREGILVRQGGDGVHLVGGHVAGGDTGGFQGQGHRPIAGHPVGHHVAGQPFRERHIAGGDVRQGPVLRRAVEGIVGGRGEEALVAGHFLGGEGGGAVLQV